jgi:FlaA1/EpsC-like NDP-sugar epimerase
VSVRFGNVLGSRGSVVHAFTAQIERGGPITVTHPDVERYFMLIPEACQLVLQAASLGADGDVMVLDMGEQVRIVDVAHTLLQISGRRDVDVVFTGLRPGEKLAEELFSTDEVPFPTDHPLVARVQVPALSSADVLARTPVSDEVVRAWMRAAASPAVDGPREASTAGGSGVVEAAEALLGGA